MSNRSLRGTRLGALSMESDEGVLSAPRQEAEYVCANNHTVVLPFSVEAEVPSTWECRCGLEALLKDGAEPEPKVVKPVRTHWDMLLERRDVADLQKLLDQRLELLRSGKIRSNSAF